ncbi:MAG: ATP-dependent DNA helicase chl1 [Vezdaea aestivalis]|nr:MAG: ATP-dependent DNA helicase chl1 [Vezdaea aestivalis]
MVFRKRYNHPYEPYNVQYDFMNAVYDCLDAKGIGILESPTGQGFTCMPNPFIVADSLSVGTGKSLSLICGALTWAREQKSKSIEEQLASAVEGQDGEPDWLVEHSRQAKRKELLQGYADFEARLAKVRARELQQKRSYEKGNEPSRKRIKAEESSFSLTEEVRFLLDDYESDDEKEAKKTQVSTELSTETRDLMRRLGMDVGDRLDLDEPTVEEELKLAQFVNEMRRVTLPPSVPIDITAPETQEPSKGIQAKQLTLGSRKNLCINPKVTRLGNATAINERCLELQQPGSDHKCSFLPNKENEPLVHSFRDHAMARIRDIEDIGELGKKLGICPYYASRSTIKPAEVVTLPYPLLLQKSAREALGISVKNHVVIIDEAHNLMDAISNLHSVSITTSQILLAREQLGIYLQKFRHKLKGKNRVYVTQVVRLLDSLSQFLKTVPQRSGVAEQTDLLAGKGVDQINLHKLMHYLQESKLARKVDGYQVHLQDVSPSTVTAPSRSTPVLTQVQSFLLSLTNPSREGKFFYEPTPNHPTDQTLKYLLLDPTHAFQPIVDDARALILAGGTLSPISDYTTHLFPSISAARIQTLSCGHVIPPSHLHASIVPSGPGGMPFEFTFTNRTSPALLNSLGEALISYASVVPDGMVVFFPSYGYLSTVISHFKASTIWTRLEACKPIFHDAPPSTSNPRPQQTQPQPSTTDSLLTRYSTSITLGHGGLLLSVLSGTLSEGINFTDALGRAVLIIGLPYPNTHTPPWTARLSHISDIAQSKLPESATAAQRKKCGDEAGREFVENAAMRAVNQAVGRAIRHKGDWAVVGLWDRRYAGRVRGKVSGWIREGLKAGGRFEDGVMGAKGFFEGMEAS